MIGIRNRLYDRGWLRQTQAAVKVISIGNLTTGGTGKTPLVIWLYQRLQSWGYHPGILTRGYKTSKMRLTDEPAILLKNCPEAKLVINPNRSEGSKQAVEEMGADILILDDGFQHRRLKRDLDLVVIDSTCPFGYRRLLPAGMLREPVASLRRADAVVITRSEQVNPEEIEELVLQIRTIRPVIPIGISRTIHPYVHLPGGLQRSTEELRGKKAMAFCGIGNPEAFYQQLRLYGVDLVSTRTFEDHYSYSDGAIDSLYEQAAKNGAEYLLTTEKDWVKSVNVTLGDQPIPLAYLPMKLEFIQGGDTIEGVISECIGRIHDQPRGSIDA